MKLKDVSIGTIARTATLLFALINQILTMMGYCMLPFTEAEVEQFVTTLLTVIASLVAWWGDNAITPKRIEAKKYYKKICSQCGHEVVEEEKGGKERRYEV